MRPSRKTASAAVALLLVILLGVGISGCSQFLGTSSDEMSEPSLSGMEEQQRSVGVDEELAIESAEPVPPEGGVGADAADVPSEDRLVIRNVAVRIQVDSVEESVDKVRSMVTAAGGNITALHVSTDDQPVYRYDGTDSLADGTPLGGYITVRVPAEKLDEFTDGLGDLGKVLAESASESDVTQEHIDLNARLKNLQAQEARLREFFDSAKTVSDMLAIEQELGRVRGEIESMQAQIAYLERQAAMATVTIELAEPESVVTPAGEDWGFVDALRTAIRAFVGTINGIIIFIGAILPIALIGLVVFLVVRALLRRRKKSASSEFQTPQQQTPPQG